MVSRVILLNTRFPVLHMVFVIAVRWFGEHHDGHCGPQPASETSQTLGGAGAIGHNVRCRTYHVYAGAKLMPKLCSNWF